MQREVIKKKWVADMQNFMKNALWSIGTTLAHRKYDFIIDTTPGCFTVTYYRQQDMLKPDG